MKVLLTGGSGLLGSKLIECFPSCYCPSHKDFDISSDINILKKTLQEKLDGLDLLIHCASLKNEACTKDYYQAFKTNCLGTLNMVSLCHEFNAKMVFISTDYVFKGDNGDYSTNDSFYPVNYYGETKLAGEFCVKSLKKYLIIRLSFCPDVYPYETAFIDQITTRLKITDAVTQIVNAVKNDYAGIIHLKGKKQSVYDYAISTSNGKEIKKIKLADNSLIRPKDSSLI